MSINRHYLTDNYRNTILDPILDRAPVSNLPFFCSDCGLGFANYKSNLLHQRYYCLRQNKDLHVEKEVMRIRSLEYLNRKPIPPVAPINPTGQIPRTKYIKPYNYDRMFKKYEYLKNPYNRRDEYFDYEDDDELIRNSYTPFLNSARVNKTNRCYIFLFCSCYKTNTF